MLKFQEKTKKLISNLRAHLAFHFNDPFDVDNVNGLIIRTECFAWASFCGLKLNFLNYYSVTKNSVLKTEMNQTTFVETMKVKLTIVLQSRLWRCFVSETGRESEKNMAGSSSTLRSPTCEVEFWNFKIIKFRIYR